MKMKAPVTIFKMHYLTELDEQLISLGKRQIESSLQWHWTSLGRFCTSCIALGDLALVLGSEEAVLQTHAHGIVLQLRNCR